MFVVVIDNAERSHDQYRLRAFGSGPAIEQTARFKAIHWKDLVILPKRFRIYILPAYYRIQS